MGMLNAADGLKVEAAMLVAADGLKVEGIFIAAGGLKVEDMLNAADRLNAVRAIITYWRTSWAESFTVMHGVCIAYSPPL